MYTNGGVNEKDTHIGSDLDYGAPSYTRHIFSTLKNTKLYVYDAKIGVVTPATIKPRIATRMYGQGVYIIDTYYITGTAEQVADTLRYYANTAGVIISDEITNDISSSIQDDVITKRHNSDKRCLFRVVHYVPTSDIMDNKCVPTHIKDVYLIKNVNDIPVLALGSNNELDASDSGEFRLVVDIVDNNNPNKKYYINVGENVYGVTSKQSPHRQNSATITVLQNGTPDIKKCPLSELATVGVYSTHDAAIYGTASKKQEAETALLKAKAAAKAVDIEQKKNSHEVTKMKVDFYLKALGAAAVIFKLVSDLKKK